MTDLEITASLVDFAELSTRLKNFKERQVPFAASLAMNRAALDARGLARSQVLTRLDVRNRALQFTIGPTGGMVQGARNGTNGWSSRKQWPNLRVTFFSSIHSLALHEHGGTKPRRSGIVWIRDRSVERRPNGRVPARYTPAKLKARMAGFSVKTDRVKSQVGPTRIFEKSGTVFERTRATGVVRPLYHLRRRAQVKPTIGFEARVVSVFTAKLYPRFVQAMDEALRKPKQP